MNKALFGRLRKGCPPLRKFVKPYHDARPVPKEFVAFCGLHESSEPHATPARICHALYMKENWKHIKRIEN